MTSDSSDERARMLAFEALLDASRSALEQHVEMNALRKLCARSIPEQPSHLRPLAYSLLLGTLPSDKTAWRDTTRTKREKYYTLVRTFMRELETADAPSDPLSAADALLLRISKDVDRLDLPVLHARTTPAHSSPLNAASASSATKNAGSLAEDDDSEGSSLEDEQENETRTTPASKRTHRRTRSSPYIDSRRALFVRLDMITDACRTPLSKGKEKEQQVQVQVQEPDPPNVTSPTALLSPLSASSEPSGTTTPSLSLTIPQELDTSQPPSPITLLSPQVVGTQPLSPSALSKSIASHTDHLPDTHSEALSRLLYVFARTNTQWAYGSTFVDIVVPLYLVYCEANAPKVQRDNRSQHAEEETYWAFTALMGELGDLVAGVPGDDVMTSALRRVSARVRWADEPLWNLLKERNLDPGLPLYSFQWLSGLMSHDRASLLPIWDFLFAQPPTTPNVNPKLDLLLDLCVALVVMVKRQLMFPPPKTLPPSPKRDMWHGSDVMEIPGEPEDPDVAFVRCLQLFRNYPMNQVGGVWMLLNTAFELNQARRGSIVDGIDPDLPAWTEARDAAANKTNWASARIRAASASTGKLLASYAESDAAARVAKASSNLTATAVARLQNVSAPAAPDWKGIGAAAGRLFSRKSNDADHETGSVSGEEYEHLSGATTPMGSQTPGSLYSPVGQMPRSPASGGMPRSPLSPEKRMSYGVGMGARKRSDSVQSSSALSVSSLQEKLTGLTSNLTSAPRDASQPTQRVTSGPRPLLLSSAARRASNPPQGVRPRVTSGNHTGITGGLASPPHHEGHPGLYRIGSRNRSPGPRPTAATDSISSLGQVMKGKRASLSSDQSTPYDSDYSHGSHGLHHSGLALSSMERSPRPAPVPEHSIPTPPHAPLESAEAPEPISIPTPQISHITEEDYEHVYEPAEDSFILLDALEADALVLRDAKPALCVEIGSGSGIASTFMGTLLGTGEACLMSTDINKYAAAVTVRTGDANDVALNPVLGNLLDPLEARMAGNIDLLIFNPPYVVTDDDELVATQNGRDIGGAWAGGNLGMAVTNILLEKLPTLLAPGGRFYLVAIHQNKPDEIIARMRVAGLECKTVIKRRAGRELLSVIRMIRPYVETHDRPTVIIPAHIHGALSHSPAQYPSIPREKTPVPMVIPTVGIVRPTPPRLPEKVNGTNGNGNGSNIGQSLMERAPSPAATATTRDSETDNGDEDEDYGVLLDAYAFVS